jgi:hypothetical protein
VGARGFRCLLHAASPAIDASVSHAFIALPKTQSGAIYGHRENLGESSKMSVIAIGVGPHNVLRAWRNLLSFFSFRRMVDR